MFVQGNRKPDLGEGGINDKIGERKAEIILAMNIDN